jgi:hypothetical protein
VHVEPQKLSTADVMRGQHDWIVAGFLSFQQISSFIIQPWVILDTAGYDRALQFEADTRGSLVEVVSAFIPQMPSKSAIWTATTFLARSLFTLEGPE